MAVAAGPVVLKEAIALQRLIIGGTTEERIIDNPDDPDNPIIDEIEVPVYAEPGDIIDVSQWAWVDAYVRRGQIQLLTPDITDEMKQKLQDRVRPAPAPRKTTKKDED